MLRGPVAILLAAMVLAGCSMLPESSGDRGQQSAQAPARSLSAPRSVGAGQCLSELGTMGASYSPLPDRYLGEGCSNLNTVQLAALNSDSASLAVSNLGPVTCDVSRAFAGWARYGVDRAARQMLGAPLARIETFGSYSCRNVAGSGRRSAHASAAAIDISAFVLTDGRRISVKEDWQGGSAQERAFLRTVQDSACKRFDTVLGPNYNQAHEDHFHLEGVIGTKSYCR
jgi:hypothetical protein